MNRLLCIVFLLICFSALSQSPKDYWFFGDGHAIRFENEEPKAEQSFKMYGFLGSTAMSDSTGQLLFYTNGSAVANRNHELMPGSDQSTFGGSSDVIAIPSSVHANLYFIYTINFRIFLKVVDMNQENGLGDVISTNEYKPADQPAHLFDAITAVKNCHDNSFWLLTLTDFGESDHLVVWKVDNQTGALEKHSSFDTGSDLLHERMEMTTSPDGSKIVITGSGTVVLDFNTLCGEVEGMQRIHMPFEDAIPRGACYSPSGEYLYLSYARYSEPYERGWLYQLKSDNKDSATLFASVMEVPYGLYGLLNGPDDRMYVSTFHALNNKTGADLLLAIDRVNQPDEPWKDEYYEPTALEMLGNNAFHSFPNFVNDQRDCGTWKYEPSVLKESFCAGEEVYLELDDFVADSLFLFDPSSNRSVLLEDSLIDLGPKEVGHYQYYLHWSQCGVSGRKSIEIEVNALPKVQYSDTALCHGDTLVLSLPPANTEQSLFFFKDGAWQPVTTADQKGRYQLVWEMNDCSSQDSFELDFTAPLITELSDSVTFCEGAKRSVLLDAGKGFKGYRWFPTGDTTQWIIVRKKGDYYVVVKDSRGCSGKDGTKVFSDCRPLVFIPNAFSPNGDGFNDSFSISGRYIEVEQMNVFDRWGAVVFAGKGQEAWDGKKNGETLKSDVYFCTLRYSTIEALGPGKVISFNIRLIR